jgi:hypothetical protein
MDLDDKAKVEEKSDDDSSSDDDGRPPPPARPQANTFGDDPSTFPDPTVYEILPVQPGMTEDEIREIYSVATYPKSDLADLIAGDPPDKDFSSAKPTNQINFSTFSSYIEPFFRPFTEEDLAFLRERGDRVTPFVMPKRGKKHYSEIWAEEDGAMAIDSSPSTRDKEAAAVIGLTGKWGFETPVTESRLDHVSSNAGRGSGGYWTHGPCGTATPVMEQWAATVTGLRRNWGSRLQ